MGFVLKGQDLQLELGYKGMWFNLGVQQLVRILGCRLQIELWIFKVRMQLVVGEDRLFRVQLYGLGLSRILV